MDETIPKLKLFRKLISGLSFYDLKLLKESLENEMQKRGLQELEK